MGRSTASAIAEPLFRLVPAETGSYVPRLMSAVVLILIAAILVPKAPATQPRNPSGPKAQENWTPRPEGGRWISCAGHTEVDTCGALFMGSGQFPASPVLPAISPVASSRAGMDDQVQSPGRELNSQIMPVPEEPDKIYTLHTTPGKDRHKDGQTHATPLL